ncbi:hypothetical protein EsHS_00005491 [Epichloe bromicola]
MVPILPFLLRDRLSVPSDQIQSYASALLAAYAGPSLMFAIPAGWLTDKIGARQRPFLAGLLLQLIATTAMTFGKTMTVLVMARLVQGLAAPVVWTTGLAMVQETTDPDRIGEAIGVIFAVISVGEVAAPVVGGVLYDEVGIAGVFGVAIGILSVDVVMRILVLDKKTLAEYEAATNMHEPASDAAEAREHERLLDSPSNDAYKIREQVGSLTRAVPIFYCFREPRFIMAFMMTLVQATFRGIFDATVPIEAQSLFHFSSQTVGLLFITLFVPHLTLSHAVGWSVDKYGTRAVATTGFLLLVPCLAALGLPSQECIAGSAKVVLFCVILALNGIGLCMVSTPAFVEAIRVTQRYEASNPGFFGEYGPYAQLYGFNCLFFSAGLTIGPIVGGVLRDAFGYGVVGIVFSVVSGVTAALAFTITGDRSR